MHAGVIYLPFVLVCHASVSCLHPQKQSNALFWSRSGYGKERRLAGTTDSHTRVAQPFCNINCRPFEHYWHLWWDKANQWRRLTEDGSKGLWVLPSLPSFQGTQLVWLLVSLSYVTLASSRPIHCVPVHPATFHDLLCPVHADNCTCMGGV